MASRLLNNIRENLIASQVNSKETALLSKVFCCGIARAFDIFDLIHCRIYNFIHGLIDAAEIDEQNYVFGNH